MKTPSRRITYTAHHERHRYDRIGWLRAGVLGAGDGVVSVASLLLGVAASNAARSSIIVAGVAGLVAGALSMAIGEYTSVSSQRDTEQADIARERVELTTIPDRELDELAHIYVGRGLTPALAREVAAQLTEHDPLGAHLRDELGIVAHHRARPLQAAAVSAGSFAGAAMVPLLAVIVVPAGARILTVVVASLLTLAALGVSGARLGGSPVGRATARMVVGSGVAMAVAAGIGALVGTAV
ncbi:MAG: VIT family protein [Actinomycetes bacterium]